MTALEFMSGRASPLRLVIFDCDGVLADSEPLANRVSAEMISEARLAITPEECVRRFVGFNLEAMVPMIEADLGRELPRDWVERLTGRLIEAFGRELRPISGAVEALRAISVLGLPWRVASNSSHAEMAAKFSAMDISTMVAGRLHSYTDVAEGKPAPDLFLAAAAAEGVAPMDCVVIEDSVTGARAAAAAGMPCLGFAPHGDDPRLREVGAHLFTSMFDLPALIAAAPR
ncbi:MAG: HAD-IA family hydrolase [Alphaproteobacteria bacterium]|nr:HAD-IA family hydrolase [Alphaproteobacteria bacterium]